MSHASARRYARFSRPLGAKLRLALTSFAAALAALTLPAVAAAEERVFSFDEFPNTTMINSQYAERGLDLAPAEAFPGPPIEGCLSRREASSSFPSLTQSSPNVLRVSPCGREFVDRIKLVAKTARSRAVSMYVGGDQSRVTHLEAYNAAGGLVDLAQANASSAFPTRISVSSSSEDIAWLVVYSEGPRNPGSFMTIDNVVLDVALTPPPPPQPDFAILPDAAGTSVSVAAGESASASLTLRRLRGSSGPVEFSASGLPAGVTPSFTPPQSAAGDARVTLRLTAGPGVAAVSGVRVTVKATPLTGAAGPAVRSYGIWLSVFRRNTFDLRARGLQIVQAIQDGDAGNRLAGQAPRAGVFRYGGVPLAYGKKTVARFYVDTSPNVPGGVRGVSSQLFGWDSAGRPLPGSPLLPETPERTVFEEPLPETSALMLWDPGAFTFTLPRRWTSGNIRLRAVASPPPVFLDEKKAVECGGCVQNNASELTGIGFGMMGTASITPVQLQYGTTRSQPSTAKVFEAAQTVNPLGIVPGPYRGEIDIGGILGTNEGRMEMESQVLDELEDWADDRPGAGEVVVGVQDALPGAKRGGCLGCSNGLAVANVNRNRPLSSVGHELGHALGRVHASKACGGDDDGQKGESWPPDEVGQIQGFGLDTRAESGGSAGPYAVIAPKFLGFGKDAYDLMSYCASGDGDSWVSTRYWRDVFGKYRSGGGRSAAAHSARSSGASRAPAERRAAGSVAGKLEVSAFVTAAGLRITRVRPARPQVGRTAAPSAFRLVAKDAAGQPLSGTAMTADAGHADRAGVMTFVTGEIPAARVSSVEVQRGGKSLARRVRTPNAPTVRLLTPAKGSVIGRGRQVSVRWRARDRDRDVLRAKVEYSATGGRRWHTVFVGPNRGKHSLPRGYFSRSRRARLRVSVNDGFNQATAVSGRFRSLGSPPQVTITSPKGGQRVPNDAALYLSGQAFDDSFRRVRPRRLRWFAGRRLLGRGESISVTGLPAGRRRIRLVASDAAGRSGSDSVVVGLTPALPRFLTLRAPAKLRSRARRLVLRVAVTVPARLKARGRSFRLPARRLTRVRVPVPRGKKELVLRLRLVGGRRSAVTELRVRRG